MQRGRPGNIGPAPAASGQHSSECQLLLGPRQHLVGDAISVHGLTGIDQESDQRIDQNVIGGQSLKRLEFRLSALEFIQRCLQFDQQRFFCRRQVGEPLFLLGLGQGQISDFALDQGDRIVGISQAGGCGGLLFFQ